MPIPQALQSLPLFSSRRNQETPANSCTNVSFNFVRKQWTALAVFFILIAAFIPLGLIAFRRSTVITWTFWFTFIVLILVITLLVSNLFSPVFVTTFGTTVLLLTKVITTESAFKSLSNESLVTIALLFILVEAIQKTSLLNPIFRLFLGKPNTFSHFKIRLLLTATFLSAFINNSTLTSVFVPIVRTSARRIRFPLSNILLPLNFAITLGGALTLLGANVNLVVDALVRHFSLFGMTSDEHTIGLPIFGFTPVALAVSAAGLLYVFLFSHWFLRDPSPSGVETTIQNAKEYVVALLVTPKCPIIGSTVETAGLRQLQHLFLVEITRVDGTLIPAVTPDTRIEASDVLVFAGVVESVSELYRIDGLVPATGQSAKMDLSPHQRRFVEVVISATSPLAGKTPKETRFRSRFNAAIIAVHRQGDRLNDRIGDIELQCGDSLLVETGKDFMTRFSKDANFALVSEISESLANRQDSPHMFACAIILIAAVAVAVAKILPLVNTVAVATFLLLACGCVSRGAAGRCVDLGMLVTIAASLSIANGLLSSQVSTLLGKFIVGLFQRLGETGLLFVIYVLTVLLSSIINHHIAVALLFPVVMGMLEYYDALDKLKVVYALMLGGTASFTSASIYNANLMIHGLGGYSVEHWIAFGVPLQIIVGVVGITVIRFYPFHL